MEVLIGLALIAGMLVMTAGVLSSTDRSKMKRTSRHLIRMIRYVYDQAAINSRYYRIVFDMTDQKYFVEYSDTPFYVVKEGDEQEMIRQRNLEQNRTGDNGEEIPTGAALGDFSEAKDEMLEVMKLPDGIRISDIYVSHKDEAVTEGRVYLYFFPKGYTEFAVIHLSDEDNAQFTTLAVNPLTGSVAVTPAYVEHEELLAKMGE